MEWLSMLGVLIALAIFIYFAYKGYNIAILTVIGAMIIFIFSGMSWYESLTDIYMASLSGFLKSWLLVYIFSAVFARMMNESGAANSIALKLAKLCRRWPKAQRFLAIMSIPLINSILTYGGVSSLVVVFIMVGIAKDLFRELDIPWHFYGVAALGSATFALGMLPGAPDVMNLAPTELLGTTPMAAPVLGILGTIMMIVMACLYVWRSLKKATNAGEGFLPTGQRILDDDKIGGLEEKNYNILRSIAPCIILLVVMNLFKQPAFVALLCACLSCLILFWGKFSLKSVISSGAPTGMTTCIMISATVAFGSAVTNAPAYNLVLGGLDQLAWMPAAFQVFICTNVVAALTSSGTSAVTISIQSFADRWLATGLAPEAIHRICSSTALGLNTLPHSVGVVNAATAARLTHKEIYRHYFWITVVFPIVASLVLTILVTMGFVA